MDIAYFIHNANKANIFVTKMALWFLLYFSILGILEYIKFDIELKNLKSFNIMERFSMFIVW